MPLYKGGLHPFVGSTVMQIVKSWTILDVQSSSAKFFALDGNVDEPAVVGDSANGVTLGVAMDTTESGRHMILRVAVSAMLVDVSIATRSVGTASGSATAMAHSSEIPVEVSTSTLDRSTTSSEFLVSTKDFAVVELRLTSGKVSSAGSMDEWFENWFGVGIGAMTEL